MEVSKARLQALKKKLRENKKRGLISTRRQSSTRSIKRRTKKSTYFSYYMESVSKVLKTVFNVMLLNYAK